MQDSTTLTPEKPVIGDDVMLAIRNLSKSFGRNRVLQHIDMDVKKGSVMGLMGENGAGKSTMMKCLFGIKTRDEGQFFLDGKEVSFAGPKDALENGIAMVHQELNQALDRSVLDNLFLGRYPTTSLGVINEAQMRREATELFRRLGMTVNLTQPMRKMSVSQRQMVEIAKAISYHSKVIVLDEPTSSLMDREVEKLFDMVRMLKNQGISIIFISHKMDEVFQICDEVSVLRDGHLVMTKNTKDTDLNELIKAMVGRPLDNRFPPVDNKVGDTILSVQHLSTKYAPYLQDISFDVGRGEIFGLYGLVGAGRTELLETIFGVRTRAAGRVYFNGKLSNFNSAKEAMEHGFAMITEERKANGLFLKGSLTFNTTITNLNAYRRGPALSDPKMTKATQHEIKVMNTKTMGPDELIASLSGGNQQKVIVGKWLERAPQVFMMDEPTRGIDVGAKYEIYELIIKMAKEGKTIIVVSSEMPEILGITNRIGVMSDGHLAGIVDTKKTNQEELLRLSAKYM
ncbi:sugar ABC transporter ATP-binding protein [Lacticaseibacillus hegangensis]|uniref:Ribose/galactose/methyl galactoside import ATP-binding protein n=1 Tax=Lacticaseibacillus hegangensis TaxID=2486010 RepID=A0ABW4CU41_9LACO|nr:sugar ABC transporter ATP-binding protein [Lacticaseibacillus hegangensis]